MMHKGSKGMKLQSKDVFERLIRRDVPRMCNGFFESIPEDQLVTTVWKHLIEKKPESQTELDFLASLPEEARFVHLIMILDGEVRNGGFNQYFFNTEGAYVNDTVAALQKMCGAKHSEPLQAAVKFLEEEATTKLGKAPKNVAEMLDAMGDAFDDIDFGNYDAEWERLDKARNIAMSRFIKAHSQAFIDSKEETAISDELKEPTKFTDGSKIKKECEAIAADNDKASRMKKYTALFTKHRDAGAHGEAEAVLREAIDSMRWMPMGGTKDPMFLEILKQYKTLLDVMDRKAQSEAIQWHLSQHQAAKTKS
jgi:hypothetical protein